MAQGTGLSLRQKQFLAVVLRDKYILENFYLSGGTALSSWYLHHRESYDLDFFSDRPFKPERLIAWIRNQQQVLKYRALTIDNDFGFHTFFLRFPDNSRLKIDFNHYTNSRLAKGIIWNKLEIDSLEDIAVNKTFTIRTSPRERDYIDLYFIIQKTKWDIKDLLSKAGEKFLLTTDALEVSKNFLKANEIENYPKVLLPFNKKKMVEFYENQAKNLSSEILR